MDAIDLLETQHRDIESLLRRLREQPSHVERDDRRRLFDQLADLLAIHASIEELHFYPAVKVAGGDDRLLRESTEEHLAVKRVLADLLTLPVDSERFDPAVKVLGDEFLHHLSEERELLFPRVRELLDEDQREALGQEMTSTLVELEKGRPRLSVPLQTAAPMPLVGPPPEGHVSSRLFPRLARFLALPLQLLGRVRQMIPRGPEGPETGGTRRRGEARA